MLYHIFGRYNTGSEKLNPAEVRNAVYQGTAIHETLWALARESQYFTGNPEEDAAMEQLRTIMGKKKRYGTYDFVGRVMAFTHLRDLTSDDRTPTSNIATNSFYDLFKGDHEQLRADFVKAFYKVIEWYPDDYAFVKPPILHSESSGGNPRWHKEAATIQMTTAHHLRKKIEASEISEDKVKEYILDNWERFAGIDAEQRMAYADDDVGSDQQPPMGIFQTRQNAARSWGDQITWQSRIEEFAGN
jgi:hypothetical protein